MKYILKLMFKWACIYGLITLLAFTYGYDMWAPVIDAYRELSVRQWLIYMIIGALFVVWLLMYWDDDKDEEPAPIPMHPIPKKSVLMELVYQSSIDCTKELRMPVDGVWHAQTIVDTLRCDNARVVYIDKNGDETKLYVADQYRDLMPV